MRLLILFGPPAVGKTTVGKCLEKQTDFELFHNHMVMDGVMHIFGRGTPAEDRLSRELRAAIIGEAADSKINLIFTYVWNFSRDKGKQNINAYKQLYESRGGQVYFAELTAPQAVRAERAGRPERHRIKAHAPTAADVASEDATKFQSPTPFYYPTNYLQVDASRQTPDEIAAKITAWLEAKSQTTAE
jgi:hypothetical protein